MDLSRPLSPASKAMLKPKNMKSVSKIHQNNVAKANNKPALLFSTISPTLSYSGLNAKKYQNNNMNQKLTPTSYKQLDI